MFVDRAFKSAGIEVGVRLEARTQHGILTLVGAGAGIALVDPCVAVGECGERVKFIPVEPAIHWDIALLLPKFAFYRSFVWTSWNILLKTPKSISAAKGMTQNSW
ncbi:LysR substrate-binding domain-containing protein [Mesorhizobium sp. M0601]|uniref:LysR substrate-binding domain-containing protein n=1 Tax=Mesorhizobium sp. M0601 TaxID=2956969 RepID=UPI00333C3CCC